MFTFFSDGARFDIPVSCIQRVVWRGSSPYLEDNSGNEYALDHEDVDRLIKLSGRQVFPEKRDIYYLEYFDCEDQKYVRKLEILGWFVFSNGQVRPIVQNFDSMQTDDYAVLYEGGRVERAYGEMFECEDDWLASHATTHANVKLNDG